MWKIWDVEYKVRREESPEQKETPKPVKGRAPTPAARTPRQDQAEKPVENPKPRPDKPRSEPVVLRAAEEGTEERVRETEPHDNADFGSSSDSDRVRGRRNRSPTPRDHDTESEKEEVAVEPEVDRTARRKRSEMTAEEKARDNYLSREAKRQKKGTTGKTRGYTRRGHVRVIQFDGWVQASGLEADDDPPEGEDLVIFDEEEL